MKKIFFAFMIVCSGIYNASAYQLLSSKELGQNDARNQNVVVKCTTDMGKITNQTCSLRRYIKCTSGTKKCAGWQAWRDLRNPSNEYADWRSAASACCRAKGLR
ncbi:MAG: hypothetical protein MJ187_02975 [Alphaproteobacteria bacterium]|nr:hypothetical protein [Alphaproteobacteria bacterium]